MSITFNADEVFEMAEEIEKNGAKFYREAAQKAADPDIKNMLLGMAEMEDGHLKIFEQMRTELSSEEKGGVAFDPQNEAALYLKEMADSHGIEGKVSTTEKLTGSESMREILEIALNAEKDSVVFYFGLRGFVPGKVGKDRIEAIINEELSHITTLQKRLASLG